MKLLRGTWDQLSREQGSVITIGNFDGVHLGHQAIVRQVLSRCDNRNLAAVAMLFEPQPAEYFKALEAPPRIMTLTQKAAMLRDLGIDELVCIRFNEAFCSLSADTFVQECLMKRLKVHHLVVGDDFRFGQGRSGDFSYLQKAGKANGFSVESTDTHEYQGERVSSTRIRHLLMQGQFDLARELLGRPYRIEGRVSHGRKLGRTIGVPTANIRLNHRPPVNGVYLVRVKGLPQQGECLGIANVGKKPTVSGDRLSLEVHCFNFDQEIYGLRLEVEFLDKIRDERRFQGVEALKKQIQKDIEVAKVLARSL